MWNPLRYSSWNKITLKKHTETKLTFDTAKTYQKRYPKDHVEGASIFHSLKLYSKKWIKTTSIFGQSKSGRKRYIEMRSIFFPSKLGWKMYVETISKFRPFRLRWTNNTEKTSSKLRQRRYVEMTSIFCPSKLHPSIFCFWRFDVKSTFLRRRFRMLCPLGGFLSQCSSLGFCNNF